MNLSSIKRACKITDKTLKYVLGTVKTGESEKNLALRINNFIKNEGASLSFPTIVAGGKHSYFIHHKPCHRKIKENEPILLDFGAKYNDFCSDLSRTIFIKKIPKKFIDIYSLVLKAQESAISKIKHDIRASKIDLIARKIILKAGYGKEFKHSLGHGLGKEIHQSPSISPISKDILKKGDMITIEPGIYLKEEGGVRIEDDILVTETGSLALTSSPKRLKDIVVKI